MDKYQKIKYISCESMYEFSENMAAVKMKGKYGFINKVGEMVIPCQYDGATVMKEGRAVVSINEKYGYIDSNNNQIVPCIYSDAFDFSEGMAAVANDEGLYGFIDKMGNVVIDFQFRDICYDGFSEGLISVEKYDKYGFIDKSGNEVIPFNYDFEATFHEGMALVERDQKYGFLNTKGEEIIPFIYSKIGENGFYKGRAFVGKNNDSEWQIIDKEGNVLKTIPIKTPHIYFSDGVARVNGDNDKCGCIDIDGNLVVPYEYEDMDLASEGLVAVKKEGKWGFVDYKNQVVIPFVYQRASPFYDELADVAMDRKGGYMIDKTNSIAFGVKKETNISKFVIRLALVLGIVGFILYKMLN